MNAWVGPAVEQAAANGGFSPGDVVGIGVDTTGSTPLRVDAAGRALALAPRYERDSDAVAWPWEDHAAHQEAAEITAVAAERRPPYPATCGGTYSSDLPDNHFRRKHGPTAHYGQPCRNSRCTQTRPPKLPSSSTWTAYSSSPKKPTD